MRDAIAMNAGGGVSQQLGDVLVAQHDDPNRGNRQRPSGPEEGALRACRVPRSGVGGHERRQAGLKVGGHKVSPGEHPNRRGAPDPIVAAQHGHRRGVGNRQHSRQAHWELSMWRRRFRAPRRQERISNSRGRRGAVKASPLRAERLLSVIAAPEFGSRARLRRVGVYQRDWAMEPPCSVCVSQVASISTIAPKSLQDSWDWRQ